MNSKQMITCACMIICFIIIISGFAPGAQIRDRHLHGLIKEQENSLKVLAEYFLNPHMIKRLEIENLEGITENLASRIYRAWMMYTNKGYPPEVFEQTRDFSKNMSARNTSRNA